MSDLVKRLRANNICDAYGIRSGGYFNPDGPEAADEIGRLREVLEAGAVCMSPTERVRWINRAAAVLKEGEA